MAMTIFDSDKKHGVCSMKHCVFTCFQDLDQKRNPYYYKGRDSIRAMSTHIKKQIQAKPPQRLEKISGLFTKKFRSQNNPELEERVLVFLLDPVPKMALRKLFQDSFIPFRERLIEDYERKAIPISFHGDYVGTHRVQNTSDMKQTRCFRPRQSRSGH